MSSVDPAPSPGQFTADAPESRWVTDAPRGSVDIAPPEWIPVVPDGVVANFTGSGAASGAVVGKLGLFPVFTAEGQLATVIRVKVPAAAAFTAEGQLEAMASIPAKFTGSGALAATAVPRLAASGTASGSGTLSAVTFVRSGMTKNGTMTWAVSATWVPITAWTANTTTYPGSSVSSDRIVVQGTTTSATVSGQAPFTGGSNTRGHTIRLVDQTGAVIATGTTVTANSGTCTVSASGVNLTGITSIGLEMNSTGSTAGTITAGATTFVTIT